MNIIAVDDERLALENLLSVLQKVVPDSQIKGFNDPEDVLEYIKKNPCDIAFLDIEMYGMSGIELAKKVKDICANINIIFVTGYSSYAVEAMSMRASGYLLKPAGIEDVKNEIENLRIKPIEEKKYHIRIQTFGNFEIFVDGIPLKFGRAKSKEVLAFLIDRKGAGTSSAEIASTIWEDKPYDRSLKNQIQTVISDMMKTLKSVHAEEIIIKKWNSISVDASKFECDYYNFLKGDIDAINFYTGEYMSNYSWAEFTTGFLQNITNKMENSN